MTDAELIARLLDWQEHDEGKIDDAREAAADRIKELKAELAGGSFYQEKDIDALQNRISAQAAEIERLRGDLTKAVEALQIARVHVANNAEGWSVSRAPSRDDLTIVDSILSVLTGDKP